MTADEVIAATAPAPEGEKCVLCDKTATVLWPVTSLRAEVPFCQTCLETAQYRLLVALGLASNK